MRMVFDSSAFVKRYIEERGSNTVEKTLQEASELGLSVICIPEIISALNRRRREKRLSDSAYRQIKAHLSKDVVDIMVLNVTTPVIEQAIKLLETNRLRAMDALHVACAVIWQVDLFVSADKRQLEAARQAGLRIRDVQW